VLAVCNSPTEVAVIDPKDGRCLHVIVLTHEATIAAITFTPASRLRVLTQAGAGFEFSVKIE
jgi:hypothetical protein